MPIAVGVTAAMTGPASATQSPVIEMMRIYIDRLNAKGGINGHKINFLVEDDQAEPSKAAANATKLVRQENVVLMINSSFSSTYGPVIAEAKRGKVPLWFAGAVCPKETHPPKPDPLLFCSTGFDFSIDIPVATKSIKEMSKEPVKLGLIGIPVPISRIGVDNAEKIAAEIGMETVDKEFIPPTAADYTPFANKIKSAGANWGYAYAPWPAEAKTFEALRRLGWTGNYMAYGHIQAEDELTRIADPGLNVFMANSMFLEGGPVFQEIRDAAAAGKYSLPATYATEGWLSGMHPRAGPDQGRLARQRREDHGGDGAAQSRYQGHPRRPAGVEQGKPSAHQAILSLVSLRSGQEEHRAAARLARGRRRSIDSGSDGGASLAPPSSPSACRCNSSPMLSCWPRSTRWSAPAMCWSIASAACSTSRTAS